MFRSACAHLVLASTALFGCGASERRDQSPVDKPAQVKLATAHEEPFAASYRTSGTVRGHTTAVLTSRTVGYVSSVTVRAGDRVLAGQVLAVLEANESTARVQRASAGFQQSTDARAEAENALRAAEAAFRIATTTHERIAALRATEVVSQQEFDEAQARLQGATAQAEMARARLRMSSSRISQARAELAEAQAALDYSRISAPFAGQVIDRRVDPGSLASPGMPLFVLEREGRVLVETAVEESRAASIGLGDTVRVEIEAVGQPLVGKIGEIVPTVDVATRAFLVKVDLPDAPASLRPGMFARVSFRVGQKTALVVPTTAITRSGALERLFVVEAERIRLRMVTLGETQGAWTEVLSGVATGERVVSSPGPHVEDGVGFVELP